MIPFFVLDRPISLEIIKGFFAENLDCKFGILTHAFTSNKFKEKFKNFPFNTPLRYSSLEDSKELNLKIKKNIIKLVDSGIFQAKRDISYEELFEIYEYLEADYGIIIDFLKDRKKTIKSAKKALEIYNKKNYSFKLVGVAQGVDLEDYLKCFEDLKKLGYKYIAIGGLLKRNGDSNYIRLSCEVFLKEILEGINKNFNPKWLFTFGIYNPKRHKLLEKYNVWGADYKGWLFEYEEDYSFMLPYLKKYNLSEIEDVLKDYMKYKKQDKAKAKELKKILNKLLKEKNLSLQEFRFKRVRENLKKKIVSKL